ncbi:MAG: sigma-70 family RNA polymerase sigma factor [Verrucomicrobia bacterium]|nr:sigma-70 family RNA polymerase sigma factor [Kiritimatiellia bacterium]MCO6401029.1 sigma-70 family RNA polymerase sigma factor [Verrucomicrobiota bacterium]
MVGKNAQEYQAELKALADGLPFPAVEFPDFKRKDYEAPSVRQPRTFVRADSSTQAVGRFLIERGTVDLLQPEQTAGLFAEIYWCCLQVRQASRRRYKSAAAAREALVGARRLISRIEAAEEELFIANRRMIVNCLKPYYWIGQMWLADFLQEASKALANAVRRFDATRGTPFYAYSQRAVQNRLRNFFRDHVRAGSFGIRPSREMQLVKNIVDTWKRDYEEEPSDEVVAKIADIPVERVNKVRAYISQWARMPVPPVSLDALFTEDGGNLHEVVEDTQAPDAMHAAEVAEVWQAIDSLPERSRHIMKLRFVEGRTLEETGKLLKLTRARIKQIQDGALKKLRQILKEPPRDD